MIQGNAFLAAVLFCSAAIGNPSTKPTEPDPVADDVIETMTHQEELVILGSSKDFYALKRQAESIAQKTQRRFSMQGYEFDPKKGLYIHFDGQDIYLQRRDNWELGHDDAPPYISIEKSDVYPGLAKGYYIIVAGIYGDKKGAVAALKPFIKFVPDAYAKTTRIYYGCRS